MSATVLARARMLFEHRRYVEAERLLRSPECADADGEAAALLAACLHNQGFHREADEEIRKALGRSPDHWYVHYVHSHTLTAPKRLMRPGGGLSVVLRDGPGLPKALAAVDRALSCNSLIPLLHLRRAELEQQRGRWRSALASIDKARALAPADAAILVRRGEALLRLGRNREAKAMVEEALKLSPEVCVAQPAFAWTLLRLGDRRRAEGFFNDALAADASRHWAQMGALECAKRSHFLYRVMAGFSDWFNLRPGPLRVLLVVAIAIAFVLTAIALEGRGGLGRAVGGLWVLGMLALFCFFHLRSVIYDWVVRRSREGQSTAAKEVRSRRVWMLPPLAVGMLLSALDRFGAGAPDAVFAAAGVLPGVAALVLTRRVSAPRRKLGCGAWAAGTMIAGAFAGVWLHRQVRPFPAFLFLLCAAAVVCPVLTMMHRWEAADRRAAHQRELNRKSAGG